MYIQFGMKILVKMEGNNPSIAKKTQLIAWPWLTDYYNIHLFWKKKCDSPPNLLTGWDLENLHLPHHRPQQTFIAVNGGNNHPAFSSATPVTGVIAIITNPKACQLIFIRCIIWQIQHYSDVRVTRWSFLISTLKPNHQREMSSLSCEQREEAQEIKESNLKRERE